MATQPVNLRNMPPVLAHRMGVQGAIEACMRAVCSAPTLAAAMAAVAEIERHVGRELDGSISPEVAFRSVLARATRGHAHEARIDRHRRSGEFGAPAMYGAGGAITDDQAAELEDKARTLASDFVAVIKALKAAGMDVKPLLDQLNAVL